MIAPAPDSSVLISQCNSRLLRKMMAAAARRDHGWARSKAREPTTINAMTSGRRSKARSGSDVNTLHLTPQIMPNLYQASKGFGRQWRRTNL